MVFSVGGVDFLVCDLMVVFIGGIGCSGGFEEEEGEFVDACSVDVEGVVVGPLGTPRVLGVDGLMGEGVGEDGVEVPHLVVDGLVVGVGGLVDQPDFDGVVDGALFVVCDADDDRCGFIGGKVMGVVFCFAGGSQEVEFSEFLPVFW